MPIAEQSPLVYLILIMMSSIIILWAKRLWIREVQDSSQGYAAKKSHSQSEGRPRCQRTVLWLHLRFMALFGAQSSEKEGQTQEKPPKNQE